MEVSGIAVTDLSENVANLFGLIGGTALGRLFVAVGRGASSLGEGVITSYQTSLASELGYQYLAVAPAQGVSMVLTESQERQRLVSPNSRSIEYNTDIITLIKMIADDKAAFKNECPYETGPLFGQGGRHIRLVFALNSKRCFGIPRYSQDQSYDTTDKVRGLRKLRAEILAQMDVVSAEMDLSQPARDEMSATVTLADCARAQLKQKYQGLMTEAEVAQRACDMLLSQRPSTNIFAKFGEMVSNFVPGMGECGNCGNCGEDLRHEAMLAALGISELTVVDVYVPHFIHELTTKVSSEQVGTAKALPKFVDTKVTNAIQGAIKDLTEVNVRVPLAHSRAMSLVGKLLYAAQLMDHNKDGAKHVTIIDVVGEPLATPDPLAGLRMELGEKVDESRNVQLPSVGENINTVASVPASRFPGVHRDPEGMTIWVNEEALQEAAERSVSKFAAVTGINMVGTGPPLDADHPYSALSGIARHLLAVEEVVPIDTTNGNNDTFQFKMEKTKETNWDTTLYDQVVEAIIETDTELMRRAVKEGLIDTDYAKPKSLSEEQFEQSSWEDAFEKLINMSTPGASLSENLENLFSDDNFSAAKEAFRVTLFCKHGEQDDRARFISMPGTAETAKRHQARCSPVVQMIEKVHKHFLNHTSIKGLSEEGKRAMFGEYLADATQDEVGISYDKKANDRCWTQKHFRALARYYVAMLKASGLLDVYEKEMLDANERHPDGVDIKATHKYFSVILKGFLFWLLSGINQTSLGNRVATQIECGCLIARVYGMEAFKQWAIHRANGIPATSLYWDRADTWEHGIKLKWDPAAIVKAVQEGDDSNGKWTLSTKAGKMEIKDLLKTIAHEAMMVTNMCYEVEQVYGHTTNTGPLMLIGFCSSLIGNPRHALSGEVPMAVIVPQPVKNLGKLPMAQPPQEIQITVNPDGYATVELDLKMCVWCATRYYSIALINYESVFVSAVFKRHGDYYLERIRTLKAATGSDISKVKTMYVARDPQRRLDGYEDLTFEYLHELAAKVDELVSNYDYARCLFVCVRAWQQAGHAAGQQSLARADVKVVAQSLMTLHQEMLEFEVSPEHFLSPEGLYSYLSGNIITEFLIRLANGSMTKNIERIKKLKTLAPEQVVKDVAAALSRYGSKKDQAPEPTKEPPGLIREPAPAKQEPTKGDGAPSSGKPAEGKGKGKGRGRGKNSTAGETVKPKEAPNSKGKTETKGKGRGKGQKGKGKQ